MTSPPKTTGSVWPNSERGSTPASLRVLVAGEAKRGKSTLVNQMIGREVLPTGVTPVTAVVTTVRRAEADEHIEVAFQDGRVAPS